jgi:hypothetical protein
MDMSTAFTSKTIVREVAGDLQGFIAQLLSCRKINDGNIHLYKRILTYGAAEYNTLSREEQTEKSGEALFPFYFLTSASLL